MCHVAAVSSNVKCVTGRYSKSGPRVHLHVVWRTHINHHDAMINAVHCLDEADDLVGISLREITPAIVERICDRIADSGWLRGLCR